jgi:hypothetical protein
VIIVFRGNKLRQFRCVGAMLFAAASFLLVMCQRVNSTDEKIIGTWEYKGFDSISRIVFRRDHVVVVLFPESNSDTSRWEPITWGTWHVEGNEIVTEEEVLPVPSHSPFPKRINRMPIHEFGENVLVREDGSDHFHRVYWSVRQRYSQLLASFYVVLALVALLAIRYASRRFALRKPLILLATATVFGFLWATMTLANELSQTGTLVISPTSLRSLTRLKQSLGVIGILTFAIGCASIALAATRPVKQASTER